MEGKMTSLKLALACGVLLAAISVANRNLSAPQAQPFWELHGAGPVSLHELNAAAEMRTEARLAQEAVVVAAR
jgi:hypothetical protein